MAALFADDFTRPDTASGLGEDYEVTRGSGGRILGGRVAYDPGNGHGGRIAPSAVAFPADQWVQYRVVGGAQQFSWIGVRVQPGPGVGAFEEQRGYFFGPNSGWRLIAWHREGSPGEVALASTAGADFPADSIPYLSAVDEYDGATFLGVRLRALMDGVEVLTALDTHAGAWRSGQPGWNNYYNSTSRGFDDLLAGDFSTGTTPVAASTEFQWQVRQAIQAALESRWQVRAVVATALEASWSVRALVAASAQVRWQVLLAVSRHADLAWSVLAAVSREIGLPWSVLQRLEVDAQLQWQVLQQLAASVDLRWQVLAQAARSIELQWRIGESLAPVLATLGLQWQVLAPVVRSLDLQWSTLGRLSQQLGLRWQVLEAVAAQVSASWEVRQRLEAGAALSWQVLAQRGASLRLQWRIEAEGDLPELVGEITIESRTPSVRMASRTPIITIH